MTNTATYLGSTGLRVSRLCLGAMNFGNTEWGCDEAESTRIVHAYLDRGHNFIDTSDSYAATRSEEILGRALQGRRDQVVLATKVFGRTGPGENDAGYSRKHMHDALHASLRRLQTDYIDVYQFHHWDPGTALPEMLRTMNDFVRQGLVRYAGCSNFTAAQIVEAAYLCDRYGWEPLVCLQPQYSLLVRDIEIEILPVARRFGLGVIPWSPLARGFLTGKYSRETPPPPDTRLGANGPMRQQMLNERNFAILDVLKEVAAAADASPLTAALAWVLAQPGVTAPIIGPKSVAQLEQNLAALEVQLSPEQLAALNTVSRPDLPYPQNMHANARTGRVPR